MRMNFAAIIMILALVLSACSFNKGEDSNNQENLVQAEVSKEDSMRESLFGASGDNDYYANSVAPFDLFGGKSAREQVSNLYKLIRPVDVAFFGVTDADVPYLLGEISMLGFMCKNGISIPDPFTPLGGDVMPYAFFTPQMAMEAVSRENAKREASDDGMPPLKIEDLTRFAYRLGLSQEGIELDPNNPLSVNEFHKYITLAIPEGVASGLAAEKCSFPTGNASLLEDLTFVHIVTGKGLMDGRVMAPPTDSSQGGFLISLEREPSAPSAKGGHPIVAYNRTTGMPEIVGIVLWETGELSGIYTALDINVALNR